MRHATPFFKVIPLFLAIIFQPIALHAGDLTTCNKALDACIAYSDEQERAIIMLKAQVNTCQKELSEAPHSIFDIPKPTLVIGSLLLGIVVGGFALRK